MKRPDNQGLISNLFKSSTQDKPFNPVSSQTLPGPESDKQPVTNVTESDSTQIVDRVSSSSEQSLPSTSDENLSPSSSEQSGHKAKKTRKIQDNWLKIWPWLYVENDVLFCRICVDSKKKNVFATEGENVTLVFKMSHWFSIMKGHCRIEKNSFPVTDIGTLTWLKSTSAVYGLQSHLACSLYFYSGCTLRCVLYPSGQVLRFTLFLYWLRFPIYLI